MKLKKLNSTVLVTLIFSSAMFNNVSAMSSILNTTKNNLNTKLDNQILLLNNTTELELQKERNSRLFFNENSNYSELYSEGQVKLIKFEFQQKHGIEDKFKFFNELDGIKIEVNGYRGIIKLTSEKDGEIILNYFETLDSLYEKGQEELKEAKAPNRPTAWKTQGPDKANLVVVKGSTRDSITAYKPTTSGYKKYTKDTNNWYSGYTKGYYDNVGNARKSWGTAVSAIGSAAKQGFTTTIATFVAAEKFGIGTSGIKAALAAGIISSAVDLTTALTHGAAYLIHIGAVNVNYSNL